MAYTLEQLEAGLKTAYDAGNMDAARKLAAVVNRERKRLSQRPEAERYMDEVMAAEEGPEIVSETVATPPQPTLGERAVGALETGATMATGMTTGLLGQIEGTVEGILKEVSTGEFGSRDAADRIEQLAMERAGQLTYTPRTEEGMDQTQAVGEALAPLSAIPPLAQAQPIALSAGRAAQQGRIATEQAAREISRRVRERLPTTTGAKTGVGAQAVDPAALRQAQADELPVPVKLTEGQKTRDFEAQRFERETAKLPEEGAPIRERFEEQNLQLQQNMDEFIDATGAEVADLRGVGEVVDKALRNRAANDKRRIRSLYKEAEKAGEMEAPVSLESTVQHLIEAAPEATTAPLIKVMTDKAKQLGVLIEGPEGQLLAAPVSLKTAEQFRKTINRNTGTDPANIRQASIMKRLIDETTEGAGGDKYKQARAARARYAKDYENLSLVRNLLGEKRGSTDRAIALEDVVRKSIVDPATSLDSVRQLRRLLQTRAGQEGTQAWKELQGATLRYIQDQMLKGVTTNQRGDRVVSAPQLNRAIESLDKTGKLDFVFGKKGAEQLRTINAVAKTVLTSPPGAINTSNTATVLAGLMDVALAGSTGVPAPLASGFRFLTSQIKDAKLKARVKKTLGD